MLQKILACLVIFVGVHYAKGNAWNAKLLLEPQDTCICTNGADEAVDCSGIFKCLRPCCDCGRDKPCCYMMECFNLQPQIPNGTALSGTIGACYQDGDITYSGMNGECNAPCCDCGKPYPCCGDGNICTGGGGGGEAGLMETSPDKIEGGSGGDGSGSSDAIPNADESPDR